MFGLWKRLSGRYRIEVKYGALITIVITIISTVSTIIQNNKDTFYREILIMPRLNINRDSDNLTLEIENVGPGPALIKRLVFADKEKCIDSEYDFEWEEKLKDFFDDLSHKIEDDGGQACGRSFDVESITDSLSATQESISAGSILASGKTRRLMSLKFVVAPIDNKQIDCRNFYAAAFLASTKIGFDIEYCSLSEINCFYINKSNSKTSGPACAKK